MNIAIIPARGGSTRVPRKNVRLFCGHPLVAWTIVQSKTSRLVDLTVLTTDDDEIESIGKQYGADLVIRRPHWPDADQAAANRPYLHALGVLEKTYGIDWTFVSLFPTSPQRLPGDIDRAIEHHHTTGSRVAAMARPRETFVYLDREGIDCLPVITDKYQRYLVSASGIVNVIPASWYKWFVPKLGTDLDADLNARMRQPTEYPMAETCYIEVRPWQTAEPDNEEDFKLTEAIMETFVLKGRGIEIYRRSETWT